MKFDTLFKKAASLRILNRRGVNIALSFLLLHSMAQAYSTLQFTDHSFKTEKTHFVDSLGHAWERWILPEVQKDSFRLTVVENPTEHRADSLTTQRVIFQKVFAQNQRSEFASEIAKYSQLLDLKARSVEEDAKYFSDLNSVGVLANKPLWTPVRNTWTLDDEKDYAAWYEQVVSTKLLNGYGIDFDCADFGIAVRWIYAHDHLLPVANSLMGSGKLFGHFSGSRAWNSLTTDPDWKKDNRFKAALRYAMTNTYTHSIEKDLYPIQIDRDFITPGSILLVLYSETTGHTQVVHRLGVQDYCGGQECATVLYGNEPASDNAYQSTAWMRNLGPGFGGFLRWRWPEYVDGQWQLRDPKSMPGYSEAQYSHPEMSDDEFEYWIYEQLKFNQAPENISFSLFFSMIDYISTRLEITSMGYLVCHFNFCDPNGALYDQYSTPSKDRRLRENQVKFLKAFNQLSKDSEAYQRIMAYSQQRWFPLPLTIGDVLFNVNGTLDNLSSDPNDSFSKRWGHEDVAGAFRASGFMALVSRALYQRAQWVERAEKLCSSSSGRITCDPASDEVKNLNTSALDISLRQVRKDFTQEFQALNSEEQKALAADAKEAYVGVYYCRDNQNSECNVSDYLLQTPNLLERMTSLPTDPPAWRYGFKP